MYSIIQQTEEDITTSKGIVATLTDTLLGWWEAFIVKLPNIAVAILVIILSFILARVFKNVLLRILRKHMENRSMRRILAKMLYACIVLIGFFLALGILNLDKALTSILAGAGVVALAIGLALQGTLSNTFSGVMLSFLPRIRIGDFVETNEHAGFVHEISLRNLVLRQPDNKYVIMPNSKFIEEPFVNYSLDTRGRVSVYCGIAYGSDLHAVKKLVLEQIEAAFPPTQGERIEFYYTEFADSSINFMVRFWIDYTKKSQMYTAQDKAILLINDLFNKHGIEIPFPIRTLKMPDLKHKPNDL
ncbi:mechanosensitive ion channel family protein [Marinirhabdus gelatinilytica]|uniref:Small conductance mechanosensitive channel n=1 Tax=Marinirhabdus gelatinilytica TaxID=1703343 RepID=A0A370QBT3_9FLAO|nr:mechanosensitive ion channel family protein [Marinirhabdus gelatinilytica]RDK85460.1 small conductance mechanosensitive channel [Marinirhabdus gelatinilytica]